MTDGKLKYETEQNLHLLGTNERHT